MSDDFCAYKRLWRGARWTLAYNVWWRGFALGVAYRNFGGGVRQVVIDLGPFAVIWDRRVW